MNKSLYVLIAMLFTLNSWATDYPLRKSYPDVKIATTAELKAAFGKAVIVDARSRFEYDTIHIKGAHSVPLSGKNFLEDLERVAKGKSAQIIFYCNGLTCGKSYKASRKAQQGGFTNVRAYDLGIFTWVQENPDKGVLLGEGPVNKSKLISKSQFKEKLLDKDAFAKKSVGANSLLIDARDSMQIKNTPAFAKGAMKISFKGLEKALKSKVFFQMNKDKTIYVMDAVGKQVKWLQYSLEKHGYKNYHFLKGGVWSFYGDKGAN